MPGGNRTGPDGLGPRTGRRFGFCSGYDSPGFTKGVPRGGAGTGRGYGRGFGRGFGRQVRPRGFGRGPDPYVQEQEPTALSKEEQRNMLKDELDQIRSEKAEIEKRLKDLGE